jgi:GT2 family glycosyltransferase
MLGCKIITNNLLGAASEDWIKQGSELIFNYIKNNSDDILEKIISCIEENNYSKYFYKFDSLSGISIITSLYKAEKYIENFLSNITKQTIFDECELILINGNSPENEEEYIKPYLQKYSNIKYIKLEQDPGIYGCWNIGIENSKFDYICNGNADDLKNENSLEILRKHLHFSDKNIDLVYGDTSVVHEFPVLGKKYDIKLSEHSILDFSKRNMIKCLPGCMPLWKKEMHKKYGMFDIDLKIAGDWEMWLRAVSQGAKFKKIDFLSGFYYENPDGKSTSQKFLKHKFLEEKTIFFKYKEVFQDNFQNYFSWFSREV